VYRAGRKEAVGCALKSVTRVISVSCGQQAPAPDFLYDAHLSLLLKHMPSAVTFAQWVWWRGKGVQAAPLSLPGKGSFPFC
jgi:hypothetical protein